MKKVLNILAKALPHAKAIVALVGAVVVAAQASANTGGSIATVALVAATAGVVWLTKNKI